MSSNRNCPARPSWVIYWQALRSIPPDDGQWEAMVITRLWRGWTATANAGAYEQFLMNELFVSMRDIHGFLGADVLRRDLDDEVAFVTLTRFTSIDDIRRFAGESIDMPVIEPRAAELLQRYEDRAEHFDTAEFRP